MKRMLPLLLLVTAIEIYCFIQAGKYVSESCSPELLVLYIWFVGLSSMFLIVRTVDFFVCFNSELELGKRFRSNVSILSNTRIDFYNYIDSYDLTSVKNKFKQFWAKQ